MISPFLRKLGRPHIRKRILNERLSEPLHINLISALVAIGGGLRARVAHDLVIRPHNAYAILSAADMALAQGLEYVSLIEFGVAGGAGLMNMAKIAAQVSKVTGVKFKIIGFDSGQGMPPPVDYRDHPDLYQHGDFPMNQAALRAALPANVELQIGEVAATVPDFLNRLTDRAPIGYVVFDLDYFSSTQAALQILTAQDPAKYLPLTLAYFDDMHDPRHNRWCGEYLAIDLFNAEHPMRKIGRDEFLADRRIYRRSEWIKKMYSIHVLDSSSRVRPAPWKTQVLENPYL
jgi:hypothetical protein